MTDHDKSRIADELGNSARHFVEACAGATESAWSVGRDRLQSYLRLLATPSLAQYSLGNQLLIAIQADELAVYPSKLGTIQQWVALGREPLKGSRAVKIMLRPASAKINPNVHDEPLARNGGTLSGLLGYLGYFTADDRTFSLVAGGPPRVAAVLKGHLADSIVVSATRGDAFDLSFTRTVGSKSVTETHTLCTPIEITRAAANAVGIGSEEIRAFLDELTGHSDPRRAKHADLELTYVYDCAQTSVVRPEQDAIFPEHPIPSSKELVLGLFSAGYTKERTLSGSIKDFIEREYKPADAKLTPDAHESVKQLLAEVIQLHVKAKGWREAKVMPLGGGEVNVARNMLVALRDSWLRMSHTINLCVERAKSNKQAIEQLNAVVHLPERSRAEPTTEQAEKPAAPRFSPFGSRLAASVAVEPPTTQVDESVRKFNPFGAARARSSTPSAAM